eukprot:TRINITY_DN5207_c0_g2_i2.p1 TRINITY_DN5207_c0_g2~~TRINITY_DN5207_c0_g2_i2.p1  ORF type:complete len:203 (+),score=52.12 TRINITY_DN5207_c0_g2_i2:67-675(+)
MCIRDRLRKEHYKTEKETSREALHLYNVASERLKDSFAENLSLTSPEEARIVVDKAEKMSPKDRIQYYEEIIETLIHKRLKTKRSCEKRIAEFEQILRLLEAELKLSASVEGEQYEKKVVQMEAQVFKAVQNNVSLCSFLNDLLSAIKKLALRKFACKSNSTIHPSSQFTLEYFLGVLGLSLIHICRCRRYAVCRSRWSPYP